MRIPFLFMSLALATACRGGGEETGDTIDPSELDADGDGVAAAEDCNDEDAGVSPTATEICDGVDNNCSGTVDDIGDAEGTVFFLDGDADGYGDSNTTVNACEAPEGYAAAGEDCDDSDAAIHPDAAEEDCTDPTDYNCDGSVGYADADGDGYAACEECDDTVATINPAGVEVCNDADDNCDGTVDEGATDASSWYTDADEDGFGDKAATAVLACSQPTGAVATNTDCDDTAATTNPDADEVCDEADNDCDGVADEEATDATPWYLDADSDGHGGAIRVDACAQPTGFLASSDDCDDGDKKTYPAAPELCDGVDNDCDGPSDEDAIDKGTWYPDADADQYGDDSKAVDACERPDGHVALGGDCNDADTTVRPGVPEACNGIDDNCNGQRDEGLTLVDAYRDGDGDGQGVSSDKLRVCAAPSGYVTNGSDCDDTDAEVFAGAVETCDDETDNNCDDLTDCEDIDNCKDVDKYCWICQDGVVDPDETCDDGNDVNEDGCNDACQLEFGIGIFDNCEKTGETGPNQQQCDAQYAGSELEGRVTVTAGYQYFEVPATGTYTIEVAGARGGNQRTYGVGGDGAIVQGDFDLTAGQVLKILVGQMGQDGTDSYDNGSGGGTFVATFNNTPLIVAGGGGSPGNCGGRKVEIVEGKGATGSGDGGYSSNDGSWCGCGGAGSGGGGFYTDGGGSGGASFVNGGVGDTGMRPGQCIDTGYGGFGGGGNGGNGGGGGGGYQGGDAGGIKGGVTEPNGAGGLSFNSGANQVNTSGANNDHGYVIIMSN